MFTGTKPFEQIVNNFRARTHVKSDGNRSSGFREKTFKDYTILYMYIAQGQGQVTTCNKFSIVTKSLTTLIMHCKFQSLVLNTF